jgi:hypothetical protein
MDEVNSNVIVDIEELVLALEPGAGFTVTVDGQPVPSALRHVAEAVGHALGLTSGPPSAQGEPRPMESTP